VTSKNSPVGSYSVRMKRTENVRKRSGYIIGFTTATCIRVIDLRNANFFYTEKNVNRPRKQYSSESVQTTERAKRAKKKGRA
jgi:hypothetical protein